ncbi:MAG: phage portal protein [Chloroflexaceae bacterium]|nr:phage portal protein [Chloroflexaceae bacterium]
MTCLWKASSGAAQSGPRCWLWRVTPSRADLDRLELWWRRLVSGVRRAWESVAIRSSVKPVVVGDGLEALANERLTTQLRQDIAAALGIPETLLSASAANYATSLSDRLNFYETTIVPQAQLISEALNEQLFGPLGLHFAFLPEQLEVYQEAEVRKARQIVALVGRPILTVNEGRALLGYAPLDAAVFAALEVDDAA